MIGLVEGAKRQKTPNEIALDILLAGLHHFSGCVCHASALSFYSVKVAGQGIPVDDYRSGSALLVCLIPTTIGGLLSASALPAWIR